MRTLNPLFCTALAKFQAEVSSVGLNRSGYGYSYADLAELLRVVRPIMAKYGLSLVQFPMTTDRGTVGVRTMLIHQSGAYLEGEYTMPLPQLKNANSAQAAGACLTYARRYAIASVLRIAADEDTDVAGEES